MTQCVASSGQSQPYDRVTNESEQGQHADCHKHLLLTLIGDRQVTDQTEVAEDE